MKKNFYILIGNIASGKSTFCQEHINKNTICLSCDGIRYMLGNGQYIFNNELEPIVRITIRNMVEEILYLNKFNLILDMAGCVSAKNRERYINIAKQYNYNIIAIVLPKISKEESVKRRLNKPHGNFTKEKWEEVWEIFDDIYDIPTPDEGFNKIQYI